jgi:hypothetical protein
MTRVFNEATSFKEEMIDAPEPSVRASSGASGGGCGPSDTWRRALPDAGESAETTCGMVITKGRSSKLGERGRGHEDHGGGSMVLVLSAEGEALVEGSRQNVTQQDDGIPGSEEGKV